MAYNNRGLAREQPRPIAAGDGSYYLPMPGPGEHVQNAQLSTPSPPSQTMQPARGGHWRWDSQYGDFVQERDGHVLRYTEYQRRASNLEVQGTSQSTGHGPSNRYSDPSHIVVDQGFAASENTPGLQRRGLSDTAGLMESSVVDLQTSLANTALSQSVQGSSTDERPERALKPYETPLDPRFRAVEKPKRFFVIGRIFKTVWFEPGVQQEGSSASADSDWRAACTPFHGDKPFAKFRWFVVVRKRLHHSLCFAITTFGGRGATKASRGRARDFVVLYPAGVVPPEPWPEEGIERDPLAVIIEEGAQYISPAARVDCGRIYTVEDNLKVMKIGRIHPDSLNALEDYYRESVD